MFSKKNGFVFQLVIFFNYCDDEELKSVFLETSRMILDTFELITQYLGQESIVWFFKLAIINQTCKGHLKPLCGWVRMWVSHKFLTG